MANKKISTQTNRLWLLRKQLREQEAREFSFRIKALSKPLRPSLVPPCSLALS